MIGDGYDISDKVVDVVSVYGLRSTRFSVASHGHSNCLIAGICESFDLVTPRIPTFGEAMTHDHRRALSLGHKVNLYAVAFDDVFF